MRKSYSVVVLICLLVVPSLALSQEDLKEKAVTFLIHLKNEEFSQVFDQFNDVMKKVMSLDKLEKTWNKVVFTLGDLNSLGESKLLEEEGYRIVLHTCNFEKGQLDIKIVFDKDGLIAGLWFLPHTELKPWEPPNYAAQDLFIERELTFGLEGWELPGNLTLPKKGGTFPVIVLVHGSGPNDRDETIGPNKPFKDIALGLSSKEIAVFRYDKRTKVYPTKIDIFNMTVEQEIIEDALAALSLVRKLDKIDEKKVFLLGHSLGGQLVPEIAKRDGNISGIIVMAGTTRPLEDHILEQTEYIAKLDGKISKDEEQQIERIRKQVKLIKEHKIGEDEIVLGAPGKYWYDLQKRDPIESALELRCPIFILQGKRDYQITMEDYNGWKEGLSAKAGVTFKLYSDLNHLFVSGKGKSTPAEYEIPAHVAEEVIKDLRGWILSN
jgi:hypothetical protein